jgi:hypothetical protein
MANLYGTSGQWSCPFRVQSGKAAFTTIRDLLRAYLFNYHFGSSIQYEITKRKEEQSGEAN